jgi:NTE family protein
MKKRLASFFTIIVLSTTSLFAAYPKVALVLSGGGARGFAQVSIVEEIQKLGIPIDFICGTSIGALVGGYYAAGYSSEEILTMLDKYDIAGMLYTSTSSSYPETPHVFSNTIEPNYSIGFNREGIGDVPGLVGDQEIQEFFSQTLIKNSKALNFSELPIPFKAVATNATNNKQIVIDSGLVQDAMRSSMSLPLIFPPYVLLDGRYTMDGGLNNNMPIDVAEDWGADIIIAIDVSSKNLKKEGEYSTLTGIIQQTVNLVTFTGNINAEQRCDLVMHPEVSSYSVLDMGKKDEIIQRGYDCVRQNKDELIAIRDRIAKTRELTEYETIGSYSKMSDPIVKEIKIVNVINKNKLPLSLINIFDKFVGKSLTDDVLEDLNTEIESFNKINNITTTSYSFAPYDNGTSENDGILYLYIRDWDSSESNVSLNIDATAGLSNSEANLSWAHANFDVNVFFDDINDTPFDSNLFLSFKDITTVSGDIQYNVIALPNRILNGYMKMVLQAGGISPANSSYMKYHVPSFGFATSILVGSEYQYSNNFRAEVALDYTIASLSDTTLPVTLVQSLAGESSETQLSYTDPVVSELLLKAGIVYNIKDQSLFSKEGLYVKYAGMLINSNNDIGFGSELSFRYSYPFNDIETFKFNFDLKLNERSEELLSSYYDVGGYSGLIGYPSYTLRRGYTLTDLTYQRYIGKYVFPLYFQAGVKLLTTDDYDPSENLYDDVNKLIMKKSTSDVSLFDEGDFGIYVGLGAPIGIATAVVGLGFTVNQKVSLVLEFI